MGKHEMSERDRPALSKLMSLDAVCRMTARSRSSIYRDVERGEFPAPLKTGPKSNAWVQGEVEAWIRALPRRKTVEAAAGIAPAKTAPGLETLADRLAHVEALLVQIRAELNGRNGRG